MSVSFDAGTITWHEQFNANLLTATSPEELSVNMSNANAARVAETLGIDLDAEGWAGSMPGEDFLGRVLVAMAVSPADEGMPSFAHPREPGQALMIEGARRPGYTHERLEQLHALAQWAVANEAQVMWA